MSYEALLSTAGEGPSTETISSLNLSPCYLLKAYRMAITDRLSSSKRRVSNALFVLTGEETL